MPGPLLHNPGCYDLHCTVCGTHSRHIGPTSPLPPPKTDHHQVIKAYRHPSMYVCFLHGQPRYRHLSMYVCFLHGQPRYRHRLCMYVSSMASQDTVTVYVCMFPPWPAKIPSPSMYVCFLHGQPRYRHRLCMYVSSMASQDTVTVYVCMFPPWPAKIPSPVYVCMFPPWPAKIPTVEDLTWIAIRVSLVSFPDSSEPGNEARLSLGL